MRVPEDEWPEDGIGERRIARAVVALGRQRFYISTVSLEMPLLNFMDALFDALLEQQGGRFETMIFHLAANGDLDPSALYCERYRSRKEAERGHARIRARLETLEEDLWAYLIPDKEQFDVAVQLLYADTGLQLRLAEQHRLPTGGQQDAGEPRAGGTDAQHAT